MELYTYERLSIKICVCEIQNWLVKYAVCVDIIFSIIFILSNLLDY